MDEIWVRQDGTVTDEGDPLAQRYVPATQSDEVLAQYERLRADLEQVIVLNDSEPGRRLALEQREGDGVPINKLVALLRAETVSQLRFPVMLRKMWSGGEVQAWLEEQSERFLPEAGVPHQSDIRRRHETDSKSPQL
jgi:hypothetical protein|tara:strand:+ start:16551 stop:16961 length:411 start_codon:yes stop_codon:yes gene_type:complete